MSICDDCWSFGITLGMDFVGYVHGECDQCGYPSSQLTRYQPQMEDA